MKSERSHDQCMPNTLSTHLEKLVSIDDIFAQMVLDEIQINRLLVELRRRIDESLDSRDRETFMKLSKLYSEINR